MFINLQYLEYKGDNLYLLILIKSIILLLCFSGGVYGSESLYNFLQYVWSHL